MAPIVVVVNPIPVETAYVDQEMSPEDEEYVMRLFCMAAIRIYKRDLEK